MNPRRKEASTKKPRQLILSSLQQINDKTTNPDLLIVLGARLDNNTPGVLLASRLDMVIKHAQTWGNIPVIVSGGQGPDEDITEAEAMLRHLVQQGFEESRIWKEEKSTSTRENLAFSKDLIAEKGLDVKSITVAIVSNGFHLFRAGILAKKAGLNTTGVAAKTPGLIRRIMYCIREIAALVKDLVLQ